MRNAIVLHGLYDRDEYYDPKLPTPSNAHWFPWLQKQLLLNEIKADLPEVPHTFEMRYEDWVQEVERFDIRQDTILVGHSMGGGFWVRYLNEHPELRVAKVMLVAPWLNLRHEEHTSFFDFTVRPEIIEQAGSFTIFGSDNDHVDVQNSVNFLHSKLPNARLQMFHNYGHFCYNDLKTDAFPELLAEILA